MENEITKNSKKLGLKILKAKDIDDIIDLFTNDVQINIEIVKYFQNYKIIMLLMKLVKQNEQVRS